MRWAALLAALACGCAAFESQVTPILATARITSDFQSYSIRRVAILPTVGEGDQPAGDEAFSDALHAEVAAGTDYDVIVLFTEDLLELDGFEPFRRGHYPADSLIELRRRFRLDAIVVASVTARRVVPPQRLGVQVDLVSCETGATLWSGGVLLDASDARTREALALWAREHTEMSGGADLVMLSPRRFARFAAWQVMQLL